MTDTQRDTRRRDLVVVAVVAVLVALPGIPLAIAVQEPCASVHFGDCWGAPIAAGLYGLVAPVLFWLGLLIGRVKRHLWIALSTAMAAVVLAMLVGGALSVGGAFSDQRSDPPAAPFVVPVVLAAALAAAVAVQRTERSWIVPACMAGGLAALWVAAFFFTSIQDERQQVEDFEGFGGELYLPDVPGAGASHSWMSSYPEAPAIRYEVPEGPGVVVHLFEAEAGGMCAAMFEYEREECIERDGVVRFDSAITHHTVAVQRGDTIVMAEWNNTSPDPDAVLESLREAEPVSAEELAAVD